MFRLFLTILFFSVSIYAFTLDKIVIVTDIKDQNLKDSANELALYIKKITDKKPNILTSIPKDKNAIILKKIKNHLKADGFIISSNKNSLTISSSTNIGVYYGIYHFLEHYLGFKFLSPKYEYIPKYAKKEFKDIYDKQEPRFEYREIFLAKSDNWNYALKNRLNGRFGHRSYTKTTPKGINLYNFASHKLLGDNFRCSGQYDFLNKNTQKKAIKTLKKKILDKKISYKDYILLEHEDRHSFCSKNLKDENPSYPFLKYSSYLAKKNPNYNFLSQAYLWSQKPPKKEFKLPQNLAIMYSPIEANFSKALHDRENRELLDNIKDWSRFSNSIFIWHYITNFGGYLLPFPNLYALERDIKNLSKLPYVKGFFLQGAYESIGSELDSLKIWIFSKLLWNPKQNIDELLKEFSKYYYGKASSEAIEYIKTLHNFINQSGDKLSVKTSINAKYLNPKNLEILDSILSKGLKKVQDSPIHKKHLIDLFSGIDYIRLIRGDTLKNREEIKKRFKIFLKNNPDLTHFAEGVRVNNILKIIEFDKKIPKKPKVLKDYKNPTYLEFQEYEMELCCGDIVMDSLASDGVSAVMSGDKRDWGFSLPLTNIPKGKWDIYATVKIELIDDIYVLDNARVALFYGIYPTFSRSLSIVGQFSNGIYKDIKIGSIDTNSSNAQKIWLSPPANHVVKYLYVDRIFLIKENKK